MTRSNLVFTRCLLEFSLVSFLHSLHLVAVAVAVACLIVNQLIAVAYCHEL